MSTACRPTRRLPPCRPTRVTFLVSDFLAFSPHDWVNAEDGGRATLHFSADLRMQQRFGGPPTSATLAALLRRQEPDADYRPLEDAFWPSPPAPRRRPARSRRMQAKFVGPAASADVKRGVVAGLRVRNEPGTAAPPT